MSEKLNLADIIEPMPGRVAVLVDTKDEITPAGLFIPVDTVRSIHESKPTQGTVVAIGSDDDDEEPVAPFKVGDVVVFGKYSGTEISYRQPHEPGQPPNEKQRIVVLQFKDILTRIKMPEEREHLKVKA